ncbi:juvenile hormone esterase-like [Plodia interpunctella]|uniref:juvenile hormone esterase-like n=1 Tax=Plodia interpunctella TaxID=58824 RepID=UPI002367657D|nr:juvenile hormone esterase-like [Plodia interpunctella]
MREFKMYICIIFICIANSLAANVRVDPLVDTKLGLIRGLRADDGDYSMFLGIPYATVRHDNPFADALPHEPFGDVFEAYNDSAVCPQAERLADGIVGTLDCLRLNIFVPNSANSHNRVPVLFYIHGGAFSGGSSQRAEFGPKYLVRHDIILITINYRLGPYGFMCLDNPEVTGNQGLKDQFLALKWVQENIAQFGGDSRKISIFGESAGAMSVDFHIHSSREKIFRSAILDSGNSLVATFSEPDKNAPLKLAQYLGLETDDMDDAISFLANSDTNSVILASVALNFDFKPCVEQEFDNVDRFVTQNWINATLPKIRNTPILIGFNSQEELMQNTYHDNVIRDKLAITFDVDDEAFDGMEEIVRHFYIGDEPITEQVRWDILNFHSDFKFNHPTIRTVRKYVENGASEVYQFLFSYVGERNLAFQSDIIKEEAAHGDELAYLFDMSAIPNPTAEDQLVIDRMTTLWTNFVKYSDPTPELTDLITTKWTPITEGSSQNYLEISSELSAKTRPYSSRMTFWYLFYKINHRLQRVYPGNNIVV